MPDFIKVEFANAHPTLCALCGAHEGPFIDTRVDTLVGRIYVCAKTQTRAGCAASFGNLEGMVAREEHASALERAQAEADKLRDELRVLRKKKEFSVEEIRRAIGLD